MSLVAVKNLFTHHVVAPITSPRSSPSATDVEDNSTADVNDTSPLLLHSDRRSISSSETLGDVESQGPLFKMYEKTESKKSWRVDARIVSDATIGLSDGLTVPFALTAGLSALGNTKVVIYGGFAELIAGAISMGLGGYLGAKSEAASYEAMKEQTQERIDTEPHTIREDIAEVFRPYNISESTLTDLASQLTASPKLNDFFMRFQHCEEEPASNRAFISALTIALGYFLGGLLPLLPYFFVHKVIDGLFISIGVMVVALFAFGYVKTCVVRGWSGSRNVYAGFVGGVQMVVVGSAAAGAAMGLVRIFNSEG